MVAGYLYVCLGALLLYRLAILQEVGIPYSPFGVAIVKALVLAKFAMLGRSLRLGSRVGSTVWGRILWKAVTFTLLLLLLSAIDELVRGWWREGSLARAAAELTSTSLVTVAADALLLLLVALPLIGCIELGRALGPGQLARLLRSPPAA